MEVKGPLGKRKVAAILSESDTSTATDSAYKRLFDSRDGKVVLKDLRKRFYDNKIDTTEMAREVGRRDVLHFINRRVTK